MSEYFQLVAAPLASTSPARPCRSITVPALHRATTAKFHGATPPCIVLTVRLPAAGNHTQLQREYEGDELAALSLDVTWTMPKPDEDRTSILVTIALPCFGDSDSDTPRLLGIVAVDLLFLGALNINEVSVFSSFLSASSDDVPRTLVDTAVVFKNQFPAVTFMDSHLLLKYHRLSHQIEDFNVFEPYSYDEHMGQKFQVSPADTL